MIDGPSGSARSRHGQVATRFSPGAPGPFRPDRRTGEDRARHDHPPRLGAASKNLAASSSEWFDVGLNMVSFDQDKYRATANIPVEPGIPPYHPAGLAADGPRPQRHRLAVPDSEHLRFGPPRAMAGIRLHPRPGHRSTNRPACRDFAGRLQRAEVWRSSRHLVEYCFPKIKQFRRVATRYEKPAPASSPRSLSPLSPYGCDNCKQAPVDQHPQSGTGRGE